jgi:hypothetical protein
MALIEFYKTGDVFVSHDEAWHILVWFFGGNAGSMPSTLTYNDRSFAQALLIEAIIASKNISAIQKLWEKTIKPPKAIASFLKQIVMIAVKAIWDHLQPADFKDPKIYQMVKDQLTRNWRSAWQIRVDTGGDVY